MLMKGLQSSRAVDRCAQTFGVIRVISIVTLLITLLITTHEPPIRVGLTGGLTSPILLYAVYTMYNICLMNCRLGPLGTV